MDKDDLTDMRAVWDEFFADLTKDMSEDRKQYLQTKEGRLKFFDWYFEGDHDEYPWAFFDQADKN